jgi:hypothetical protein
MKKKCNFSMIMTIMVFLLFAGCEIDDTAPPIGPTDVPVDEPTPEPTNVPTDPPPTETSPPPPLTNIEVKAGSLSLPSGEGVYDFGGIIKGNMSPMRIFTIYNLGEEDLILTETPMVILGGNDAADFTVETSSLESPVATGANSSFIIYFHPEAGGTKNATITIPNSDPDENPYTFDLTGKGLVPEINIMQGTTRIPSGSGTYSFGKVSSGTSSTGVTFTIENIGEAPLHLTGDPMVNMGGTNPSDFTLNSSTVSSPVNSGGGTTSFTVAFKPLTRGAKSAVITVQNNDEDENPYTFTLRGEGIEPEINVRVDSTVIPVGYEYNFGKRLIGTSSSAINFIIENIGTDVLALTNTPKVNISGTHASEFELNCAAVPSSLPVSESTYFTVTFKPTSSGAKTAVVSIANDDANENPYTFTVKGEGAEPEINIKAGSTSIPVGSTHYFGRVNEAYCGNTVTFTVENTGSWTLELSGDPKIVVGGTNKGDFSIDESNLTSSIAPGSSSSFTIQFCPQVQGRREATIAIENSDGNENQYWFSVYGYGNDRLTPTKQYTSAGSRSFRVRNEYSRAVSAAATRITIIGGGGGGAGSCQPPCPGGGCGLAGGGGGGAGQVRLIQNYIFDVNLSYRVIVGAGGAGGKTDYMDYYGSDGSTSSFEGTVSDSGKGGTGEGGDGYPAGKRGLCGAGGNNETSYGAGGKGGCSGSLEPGSAGGSGAVIIQYTVYVEVD